MPSRHVVLAAVVAVLWGVNFVAINISLEHFPPLFLVGFRFALIAVPTLLFIPRPQVPAKYLIGYGLGFGTFQFAGLYLGMAAGFPAGLASLVLQSSAPFTVILGALLLKEKVTPARAFGIVAAVLGLALVGISRGATTGWLPFFLVVFGGFSWALGNLASRKAATPRPLHLILWMTTVPPLPMFALSLLFEGPATIADSLATSLSVEALPAWVGLAYTVLPATLLGSGIWVWLMARYDAGVVAPFSMLVPIVGIATAWLVLGEQPTLLELSGGALVVGGVLWSSRRARPVPAREAAPVSGPAP